jgi:hypothetical protein
MTDDRKAFLEKEYAHYLNFMEDAARSVEDHFMREPMTPPFFFIPSNIVQHIITGALEPEGSAEEKTDKFLSAIYYIAKNHRADLYVLVSTGFAQDFPEEEVMVVTLVHKAGLTIEMRCRFFGDPGDRFVDWDTLGYQMFDDGKFQQPYEKGFTRNPNVSSEDVANLLASYAGRISFDLSRSYYGG